MNKPLQSAQDVFFDLDKALRIFKRFTIIEFQKVGINLSLDQWVLLSTISEEKGLSQVQLAEITNKDTASTTRILDLLHDKGFIRRVPNMRDKRKSSLKLTNQGQELIELAKAKEAEISAKVLDGITKSELQATLKTLESLLKNMA